MADFVVDAPHIHATPIKFYSNKNAYDTMILDDFISLGKYYYLKSIPKDMQNNFVSRIVYYLNSYFIINGIVFDKNNNENLYKKVADTLITYQYIGNFEKFILDNYSLIFDIF